MSSRWDALKPSSNSSSSSSKKKEYPTRAANSHQTRTRNSSSWQPGIGRGAAASGQWGSQTRQQAPANQPAKSRINQTQSNSSRTNAEWSKLVKELRESTNNNTAAAVSRILHSLSRIWNDNNDNNRNTIISEEQRWSAIAAALNTLNFIQDKETVARVVEWACEMLDHSTTKRNGTMSGQYYNSLSSSTGKHGPDSLKGSNLEYHKCIQGLITAQRSNINLNNQNSYTTTNTKYHQCCMRFIICLAPQLPPEETAHELVGKTVFPFMEAMLSNFKSTSREGSTDEEESEAMLDQMQMLVLGLQAIQSLLQVKKHASALLAPLVKDVALNGQELYLINPLRKRLFQLFQNSIQQISSSQGETTISTNLEESIYRGLASALQVAIEVDKSSSSVLMPSRQATMEKIPRDLDALVIERFFQTMFRNDDFLGVLPPVPTKRKQILNLLLAFLKYQPDAPLSLGSILLLRENQGGSGAGLKGGTNNTQVKSSCPHCGCDAAAMKSWPGFLNILHGTRNGEESDLLMASLAIMVSQAPWKLWLGGKFPQRQNMYGSFSARICKALLDIIDVTACLFKTLCEKWQSQATTVADSFLSLLKATLLRIPYESCANLTEGQCVMEAAFGLFTALSDMLLHGDRYQYAPLDRLTELFEECMGGRITPQGLRTKMIAPAINMLSTQWSRLFLDGVFCAIEKQAKNAATSTKMFRSILRTRPETVLGQEADWKRYQGIIVDLCKTENATMASNSVELLEGLLLGRQHDLPPTGQLSVPPEVLVTFVLGFLPQTIQSQSSACRRLCLQAYGLLLGSDWFLCMDHQQRVGSMKHHTELILQQCVSAEQGAAVRSAACKAIGDICSNCFLQQGQPDSSDDDREDDGARDRQLELIGPGIFMVMQTAMRDTNASVRSMAVFAVGNLAQVSLSSNCWHDPETLKDACLTVCECIADENEKVSANAIRSVGHLATVALRGDYTNALQKLDWNVDEFCAKLVDILTDRIDAVPKLVQDVESGSSTLSWKQRSTTKKTGRVACNALALLLKHWTVPEEYLGGCQKGLGSAVKCVQSLGSSLDEKVIIAAIAVLQTLPASSLAKASGKSALVGNALVACICYMAKESWSKGKGMVSSQGKLLIQVELLCEHLVNAASTTDATMVISCDEIADSWMEYLYDWMVLKKFSTRAFDVFALALQKPGLRFPVTVEHRYANRAMHLFRDEDLAADSDDEL